MQSCLYDNTLVCLPTGLGKTFIAAVVMYNFYRWYPQVWNKLCMPAKKFKDPRLDTDCWYFLLGKNCFHGSNQTTGSSADTSVLQDHGNPTGDWSNSSISAWYVMITMHRTTWWRWPGMLQWTKEATLGYQRESSSSLRRWRRKDFESFTFCQLFVLLG